MNHLEEIRKTIQKTQDMLDEISRMCLAGKIETLPAGYDRVRQELHSLLKEGE